MVLTRGTGTVLVAVTALTLAACGNASPEAQSPESTNTQSFTVVDDVGRNVTFDKPVTKAVVANRYNSELIRAMGSIDKVIAVDTNTAQDRKYWKQFDPDQVIGKGQSELNYEQIITLAPDVLITPKNGPYEQDAAKLDKAGIKVVVVTGWDNSQLPKQVDILGKVFDNEEGAKKVNAFFTGTLDKVKERTGSITPKKTVYWEYGDPFTTCIPGTSNDGWHNMLVSAGATNLFGDPSITGDTIDPEKVLSGDPDLIIKTTSGKALKNTGISTPPSAQEMQEVVDEMTSRPGWSQLKAVKNNNLYVATGFAHGGLGKVIGTVYTAKWLYPEQMKDIDPDAIFDEWMQMQGQSPIKGHTFRAGTPGAA
ncbi:ABC transporter substrate-binding protein [Gephyromycinifex aptenodytis]|uniref:ABC transporter substrate-binding protein n=1 Tax=Gephyromycinifex aptenodytis TaxID=2716227 RepID=UPI001B2FEEC6|nr:ABC transporter substrate-binding protein [Gephyromycinifex aptenodytis]